MERILPKDRLDAWVAALSGEAEVLAPALEDGVWAYRKADGAVSLDYPNTKQPPKGLVFPQREVFFSFEHSKGQPPKLTPTLPQAPRRVAFGVRPCDGRAVPRMDKVFGDGFDDPYYRTRRDNVAYVGLACNRAPSPNCFCESVGGSPVSSEGLDVLLTDLGDRYFALAATETGKALLAAAGELLAEPAAADREATQRVHAEALAQPQRAVHDPAAAPAKLRASFASPLWQDLARACIGCGICTFLCPTCHCFDINDEVTGKAPLKGKRVRTWDTCQFPDFTMHTSGHNPREDSGARLRQRVCHKFQYFFENFGMLQCTGCGRCVSECPVGIDIVSVVNKVVEHAG